MAARLTAYLVAFIVGATFIAGLIVGAQRADDGPVDLIIVNGRVFTGREPTAEAVAVQGNKVLRVGTNREIQRLARAQTTVIDARGGSVLPGFNDAHVHLMSGGLALDQVSLDGADTVESIRQTIKAWADVNPTHAWIRGRGWQYLPFGDALPTRQLLDRIVPDRPAYLVSDDGHTGWANTAALALAGITRATEDPANGVIVRDSGGDPTGVLEEAAMSLMSRVLPVPSRDERLSAARAAIVEANRVGITSVQNAGGSIEDLEVLDELRDRGDLTVRVYQALSVDAAATPDDLDALDHARERFSDDALLKTGAVTLVADGVIETRTAAMLAPYAGSTERGYLRSTPAELNAVVTELDRRGWQVMTHAVGDAAVRATLDAYGAAVAANPVPDRGRRHRIEHIETPDPEDVPRFGQLAVVASVQPAHGTPPAPDDPWAVALGDARAARGWHSASLLGAGATLVFGSDWPVVDLDPLVGIFVAVNRTSADGVPDGGWVPDERLSLADAINAFTSGGAWASFDDQRKGSLERGMLADIVILSEDLFALPPERLLEAEVVVTVMDGKVVYRRDAPETTDH
ncbi:MAG: amidohydrolase [Acidobacteriota bacterium]|nr:amidohydrolase [Acidobacteriota bacterium]